MAILQFTNLRATSKKVSDLLALIQKNQEKEKSIRAEVHEWIAKCDPSDEAKINQAAAKRDQIAIYRSWYPQVREQLVALLPELDAASIEARREYEEALAVEAESLNAKIAELLQPYAPDFIDADGKLHRPAHRIAFTCPVFGCFASQFKNQSSGGNHSGTLEDVKRKANWMLEEATSNLALADKLAANGGSFVPPNYGKPTGPTPSRLGATAAAALLLVGALFFS